MDLGCRLPESYKLSSQLKEPLDRWLGELVRRGGSDLLLVADMPPSIRFEGQVQCLDEAPLRGENIEHAVLPALGEHALEEYRQTGIADSSYRIAALGRFRINLHRERGRAAAAVRALPSRIPTLQELRLWHIGKEDARICARHPDDLETLLKTQGNTKGPFGIVDECQVPHARFSALDQYNYQQTHSSSGDA
jgi:hypothetical protein